MPGAPASLPGRRPAGAGAGARQGASGRLRGLPG
ncbi:MAG: hypothetical protein QJR08_01930 [Bacillota bacterium]|nr:hypothetical protein [Bacillota bacterium]